MTRPNAQPDAASVLERHAFRHGPELGRIGRQIRLDRMLAAPDERVSIAGINLARLQVAAEHGINLVGVELAHGTSRMVATLPTTVSTPLTTIHALGLPSSSSAVALGL